MSGDWNELLARVDERTIAIQNDMQEIKKDIKSLDAAYIKRTKELEDSVDAKFSTFKENYVSMESFEPVRKIVYGLVALILSGAAAALLGLIFK